MVWIWDENSGIGKPILTWYVHWFWSCFSHALDSVSICEIQWKELRPVSSKRGSGPAALITALTLASLWVTPLEALGNPRRWRPAFLWGTGPELSLRVFLQCYILQTNTTASYWPKPWGWGLVLSALSFRRCLWGTFCCYWLDLHGRGWGMHKRTFWLYVLWKVECHEFFGLGCSLSYSPQAVVTTSICPMAFQ